MIVKPQNHAANRTALIGSADAETVARPAAEVGRAKGPVIPCMMRGTSVRSGTASLRHPR